MTKNNVVIGILGTTRDVGKGPQRWANWRPTVSLFQQEDLLIHRIELLFEPAYHSLSEQVSSDIRVLSPETEIRTHSIDFGGDAWDFEAVYAVLHEFARNYPFDPDEEEYLIHISTGSHVMQISLFLLTEAHYFPAKLIQTAPPKRRGTEMVGEYRIIDLDLSKYDRIAMRFRQQQVEDLSFLKSGIETKNREFNRLIERIEQVAIVSREPILLMGPTGAGKSKLARRIYELKKARRLVQGELVEVNSSALRGDASMSALFGHVKGAFTGALTDRGGLLKKAHGGVLFLDEIADLPMEVQTMLLQALEQKTFLPMGSDHEVTSDFQLIAGTNRDLGQEVRAGRFREDLLARINLWTFRLPGLHGRREDIEPNLLYELEQYAAEAGTRVTFNKEARERFLAFATSPEAAWEGNFRDLNGAIRRMAALAPGGRISVEVVEEEILRLKESWNPKKLLPGEALLNSLLGPEQAATLDRFDKVQLIDVLEACRESRTLSEAGRLLFAQSRLQKKDMNDADRLRKYLAKFGLEWGRINEGK